MLTREGDQIRYDLSWIENFGAFGLDPKANISNLQSVKLRAHPWTAEVLRGIRAPGTGFPFLIMLGTMRYRRGKDFCVVYRRWPVLVLEFQGEKYNRWIIPAATGNRKLIQSLGLEIQEVNA